LTQSSAAVGANKKMAESSPKTKQVLILAQQEYDGTCLEEYVDVVVKLAESPPPHNHLVSWYAYESYEGAAKQLKQLLFN
jgi:hypothetical protein